MIVSKSKQLVKKPPKELAHSTKPVKPKKPLSSKEDSVKIPVPV